MPPTGTQYQWWQTFMSQTTSVSAKCCPGLIWAPGVGLGSARGQPHSGHREAARQHRPGDDALQVLRTVHGWFLLLALLSRVNTVDAPTDPKEMRARGYRQRRQRTEEKADSGVDARYR